MKSYTTFDALKSRTRGYALDYELIGYQNPIWLSLILANRELVDALSFIVHSDKAYERGRKIAEIKEEIPRHLFEILYKLP